MEKKEELIPLSMVKGAGIMILLVFAFAYFGNKVIKTNK